MRRTASALALLASLLVAPAALAAFSDVPANYPYKASIDRLAGMGVIKGNPDGTYQPYAPVNRAQMLTLLYRAAGLTPATATAKCRGDVPLGAWFTDVVCDAIAREFVSGYADGTFGPDKTVSRAEALKMTFTVLGLPLIQGEVLTYTDIPSSAWFHPFVAAALQLRILPFAGGETLFVQHQPLARGEAAGMIDRGMTATVPSTSSSSERSASTSSVASSTQPSSAVASRTSTSRTAQRTQKADITLPLSGRTEGAGVGDNFVYTFSRTSKATIRVSAKTEGKAPSCTLYKIEDDGLTFEYYVGSATGGECWMRVALSAGKYQLELSSRDTFSITTAIDVLGSGDGNDGFGDARPLELGKHASGDLVEDDSADWFTVVFTRQTQAMVVLTPASTSTMQCTIYPLKDVTLAGFAWPVCNQTFMFERGTYVIGVLHSLSALQQGQRRKEAYTIRVK
ncbi:MAG: S-layer domain-containing protein [Candidatus Peregrinibacteria bacterium Gr01-1014_25]|nr:MAG: S-layer domain-containing protein [Candidatus Peregrinibacteria bacterium Gr01-1014_25]